jgi:hypothetical protein
MKALILLLALAVNGQAAVIGTTPIENLNGGLSGPQLVPVGTPVFALNNALTGTSSAAIDLSGTAGLTVSVTSTGSTTILVYFSNSNLTYTTGAQTMYTLQSPGSYPVEIKGRYVSFYNKGNLPTNTASLSYLPWVNPPVSATSSGGMVNAFITGTVNVLDAWTTPLYIPVSAPAYAATTAWMAVNVSTLAGASCADCRLYWQTYNATGMEWIVNRNHLLTPTAKFFTAVSVTATLDDGFTNGDVFTFRLPSGAADVNFMAKTRTAR